MSNRWKGGKDAAQRRYRKKHREKRNAQKREYYRANRDKIRAAQSKYWHANKGKVYAYNAAWQRRKLTEYRETVIAGYGHACICCGITETVFLQIHHPEGDGKADRRQKGGNSMTLYKWLIENKFPKGYELLCANCHIGIHQSEDGICPHKKNQ